MVFSPPLVSVAAGLFFPYCVPPPPASYYTAAPDLYLCHAAPPTVDVVGGAHNSPIANATILKSGLVHYRLHLYNQGGVFYFPWAWPLA